jgi:hypothetical protein
MLPPVASQRTKLHIQFAGLLFNQFQSREEVYKSRSELGELPQLVKYHSTLESRERELRI